MSYYPYLIRPDVPFIDVDDYLTYPSNGETLETSGGPVVDPYGFGDTSRICHRDMFYRACIDAQNQGIGVIRFTGNYLFERPFFSHGGTGGIYAGLISWNNIIFDGNSQGVIRTGIAPSGGRKWFPEVELDINSATSGTYYYITSLGTTSQADWNTFFGTSGVTYVAASSPTGNATNENYAAVDGSTLANTTGQVAECIPVDSDVRQFSRGIRPVGAVSNSGFINCTMDRWGWWQFGNCIHFGSCTSLSNWLFHNVAFIDSTNESFGNYRSGDLQFYDSESAGYVEINAPTAGAGGDCWMVNMAQPSGSTFSDVKILSTVHNASEHQWVTSGEQGGATLNGYTVKYNDVTGSRSVALAMTSESVNISDVSFPTYQNVDISDNVFRNVWNFQISVGLDGLGSGQDRRVKLQNVRIHDNTFIYDNSSTASISENPSTQNSPMVRVRLGKNQQAGDVTNLIVENNEIQFDVGWNQTSYPRTNGCSVVCDEVDSNTAAPDITVRRNNWDTDSFSVPPANLKHFPSPDVANIWPDFRVGHLRLDSRSIVSGSPPFDTNINTELQLLANATYLFHVHLRSYPDLSADQRIIYQKGTGTTVEFKAWINNQMKMQTYSYGGGASEIKTVADDFPLKEWVTVVVKYSGSTISIWWNGVEKLSQSSNPARRSASAQNAVIGGHYTNTNQYWDGGICFVRIWNAAIRDSAIAELDAANLAKPVDEDLLHLVLAYDWRDGQSLTSDPLGGGLVSTLGTFTLNNTDYSFPRRQPILTVG